jgi:hypothetical protein
LEEAIADGLGARQSFDRFQGCRFDRQGRLALRL